MNLCKVIPNPNHASGLITLCLILSLGLTSCQSGASSAQGGRLKIVATTNLVGDVVSQVGGDKITLDVLLPVGTDPHSFNPSPRDASRIADATIVFANGAGLEEFLKPLMDSVGGSNKVVEVSQGTVFRQLVGEDSRGSQPVNDPHTWMDPNNVIIWVDNIAHELCQLDPENAAYYLANAQSYQEKLKELDTWIRSQVAQIPTENRKLVTEHLIFGYFLDRYGFTQVGAIIPGFSSLAEPSAQDIVQLENAIHQMSVKAIFISVGVNPNLAQRIAADTGTTLVFLYMHSLTEKGGEADNYIDFMHYDVNAIVSALK